MTCPPDKTSDFSSEQLREQEFEPDLTHMIRDVSRQSSRPLWAFVGESESPEETNDYIDCLANTLRTINTVKIRPRLEKCDPKENPEGHLRLRTISHVLATLEKVANGKISLKTESETVEKSQVEKVYDLCDRLTLATIKMYSNRMKSLALMKSSKVRRPFGIRPVGSAKNVISESPRSRPGLCLPKSVSTFDMLKELLDRLALSKPDPELPVKECGTSIDLDSSVTIFEDLNLPSTSGNPPYGIFSDPKSSVKNSEAPDGFTSSNVNMHEPDLPSTSRNLDSSNGNSMSTSSKRAKKYSEVLSSSDKSTSSECPDVDQQTTFQLVPEEKNGWKLVRSSEIFDVSITKNKDSNQLATSENQPIKIDLPKPPKTTECRHSVKQTYRKCAKQSEEVYTAEKLKEINEKHNRKLEVIYAANIRRRNVPISPVNVSQSQKKVLVNKSEAPDDVTSSEAQNLLLKAQSRLLDYLED